MNKQLDVYHCNNGMCMVFDPSGAQVPEFQRKWEESKELLENAGYRLFELFGTSVMGRPATRYAADLIMDCEPSAFKLFPTCPPKDIPKFKGSKVTFDNVPFTINEDVKSVFIIDGQQIDKAHFIKQTKRMLNLLTDAERAELISSYCNHCDSRDIGCRGCGSQDIGFK